jgi:hypothetical protein
MKSNSDVDRPKGAPRHDGLAKPRQVASRADSKPFPDFRNLEKA